MRTKIIYEDEDILVCHKMPGMAVETKSIRQTDMVSELKNYLAQKNNQKTEGLPAPANIPPLLLQPAHLTYVHRPS